MIKRISQSVLLVGLVTLAGGAYAQNSNGEPWDKFNISLGGFASRSNSSVQLNDETTGLGVSIDLENTLNVDSSLDTVRLDSLYRWGDTDRHQIEFHYFANNREGVRTLSQDIKIGDITYNAGDTLTTNFDMEFFNVDYAYAIVQSDEVRLALSGGLHITGVELTIDSNLGAGFQEEESFTAPLPVLGFRLDVNLAKNWRLRTRTDVFYLEYDNFTGGLADSYFGVEWNPFKHVGFGLGYNNVTYRVKGDGSDPNGMDFSGKIDVTIAGLLLYARYFF